MSEEGPGGTTPTPGHRAELMSTPSLLALAVVAFVVELALFCGAGAIAFELVGGGPAGWLAAASATLVVLAFWGAFMAPRSRRRLATGPRLVASAVLCLATAAGLVAVGHPWWGWFVGVAGVAVVVGQLVLPRAEAVTQAR